MKKDREMILPNTKDRYALQGSPVFPTRLVFTFKIDGLRDLLDEAAAKGATTLWLVKDEDGTHFEIVSADGGKKK